MPDSTTSFDPVSEQLLTEAREREAQALTRPERITYWTSSAGFVAASLALFVLGSSGSLPHEWVVALLVASFAFASRLEFEAGSTLAIPTELVLVEMLFLLPPAQVPLWVALGSVLSQAPEYLLRIVPVERMLVVVGSSWFALGPALVFVVFHPEPAATGRTLAILAAALAAQFTLDVVSTVVREWAALRTPPRQLVSQLGLVFSIDVVLAPLGLLAAIAARDSEVVLFLPLPLLFMIGLSTHQRRRQADQALELSHAYRGTAFLLGDVVEADDEYTGAHSRDVLDLVLAVSDELGLDARSRVNAEFVALLHDVGKIKVPAAIINKAGPLSEEERAIMNMHTIEGQRLLERVGGRLAEVGRIVRSCHEHWDGGGYPDRLAGEEIPLVARIVCCCDAFSAMTTHRSYRRAMSRTEALAELEACAGMQFDPFVVTALVRLVHDGNALPERTPQLVGVPAPAAPEPTAAIELEPEEDSGAEESMAMLFQLVGDRWPRAQAARERAEELREESAALRAQAAIQLSRALRNGSRGHPAAWTDADGVRTDQPSDTGAPLL
jgi:HD-GYP domain-containing protein (c-di-GMP phosphodiesterase class II)